MRFQNNVTLKIKDALASRHEPESARVLGEVYWAFLVSVLIVVTIGGVVVGVREFLTPYKEAAEESVTVSNRKSVSKAEIVKILEIFDARAKEYEARRTAPASVRDPS